MELIDKVGRYEFLSEPFHCDFSNHLFMGNLGNLMLNAADFHSNDRGYGMNYLNTIHKTWVLSRLAIEMKAMPISYDKFAIETWVESAMRYFTSRNFKVENTKTGEVYGYGKSIWAMIDTETRQPTDIFSVSDGLIKEYIEKDKECPINKASRVQMTDGAQLIRTIDTNYCDVDINGHINSVKYIEHVMDLWDIEWYKQYRVERFEMAYVAESHCGDKLSFFREQTAENEYSIRIDKIEKNSGQNIEVGRSKVKFVKD